MDSDREIEEQLYQVLADELGPGGILLRVGSTGRTWFLDRGAERFVIKRFGPERKPAAYVPLFEELYDRNLAPRLCGVLPANDGWHGMFEFVDGELLTDTASAAQWGATWRDALQVLVRLEQCNAQSLLDLYAHWMARFDEIAWHDGPAELLRDRVRMAAPATTLVVAHGDFSAQNFVRTPLRLVLLDWEEAGRAPVGFDVGWALALGHLSGREQQLRVVRENIAQLRVDEGLVRWGFRVALLRLFYRVRTWPLSSPARAAIATRLRSLIIDELNDD